MPKLPADLPENWTRGQIISPDGTEVGLTEKHGYNYLMKQVNATQEEVNSLISTTLPPQIIVTSKNGSTVTCVKDETTLEQISSGTVTFDLDSYGTWHVTATADGVPIETDVLVDDVKQYKISLIGIVATVHVATSSGAVVTATNGTLTLGGLGSTSFELLQSGDWVFTAKLDDTIVSTPLVVEVGNTYQVDLRMLQEIKLLSNPNKTDYLTNEQFDKTGLVVSAVFKDGTVEDVTDRCGFSPNVMTYDTSIVTVTFNLNGISKTVDIPVTVSKRQGTIQLNTEELNLSESVRTGTIVVDTQNTGDIVATSSDISVATVTVIEKTITVTFVNPGVTMISVYAKEDNTYLQTNSAKCMVTVAKYAGTISVSPTSLSLTASTKIKNITVTTNSTGTVIAKSNNSSIATVSVSGKTVKVTGVKSGSTSVTIYVASDSTYEQTITKTVSVSVQLLPEKRPLEEMSWAEIRQVSDAGLASSYWSVGDTKTITLNGTVGARTFSNYQVRTFILGFNHNASKEGSNRIHFCIGKFVSNSRLLAFIDENHNTDVNKEPAFHFNETATNIGGWKDSYMRNTIMTQFRNALPSDLKSNMKTVTKYTNNVATTDYLFLFSLVELGIEFEPEYGGAFQKEYDYFIAGNSEDFTEDYTKPGMGYVRCASRNNLSNDSRSIWSIIHGLKEDAVLATRSLGISPCFCI